MDSTFVAGIFGLSGVALGSSLTVAGDLLRGRREKQMKALEFAHDDAKRKKDAVRDAKREARQTRRDDYRQILGLLAQLRLISGAAHVLDFPNDPGPTDEEFLGHARAAGKAARALSEQLKEWRDTSLPTIIGIAEASASNQVLRLVEPLEDTTFVRALLRVRIASFGPAPKRALVPRRIDELSQAAQGVQTHVAVIVARIREELDPLTDDEGE